MVWWGVRKSLARHGSTRAGFHGDRRLPGPVVRADVPRLRAEADSHVSMHSPDLARQIIETRAEFQPIEPPIRRWSPLRGQDFRMDQNPRVRIHTVVGDDVGIAGHIESCL